MTQTEQWMIGLAIVYGAPSFFAGIGVTLLFVRWRDRRRATAMTPLAPKDALEVDDFLAFGFAPKDDRRDLLLGSLKLR